MAIRQIFLAADSSTFANWKAWAKEISDAFIALGWVRSSDTGQVNWGTIAAIPANASPVYEIFAMNDSLQATSPFFLKVEYGQGTIANQGSVWLTPGNTTNGAGQVSGSSGVRQQMAQTTGWANQGATAREMNSSGNASRINMYIWRDGTTQQAWAFGFERSDRNNAGAEAGEHATFWFLRAGAQTPSQQTILKAGGGASPGVENDFICMGATTQSSSQYNNKIATQPVCAFLGNYSNPLSSVVGLKAADHIDGALIQIPLYGTNRDFMTIKNSSLMSAGKAQGGGAVAMAWF